MRQDSGSPCGGGRGRQPRYLTPRLWVAGLFSMASMLLSVGPSSGTQETEYPTLVDWADLDDESQAHYVSSYDRSGGNDDGFNGTYSSLYSESTSRGMEYVIFDSVGPGCLYTLWFTSRKSGFSPLDVGRLRFYFDEDTEPRLDVDANDFFSSRIAPFASPAVFSPFQSSGGHVSYVPFCFASRLKISTSALAGFYNAYYVTYGPDRSLTSWTAGAAAAQLPVLSSIWQRAGVDPKQYDATRRSGVVSLGAPGMPDGDLVPVRKSMTRFEGDGAITAIRVNPLMPLTAYQLRHLSLRIFWDGEREPSVDVPLGMFFGSGLGEASVRGLVLGMSPSGAYYNYLLMPFAESAHIELVNENPEAFPDLYWEVETVDAAALESPPSILGRLHVRSARSWPATGDSDHVLLATEGTGRVVGQVMTVEPIRPEVKRWWEGDLRIFVDGKRSPSFHGTGHEDEYLGGWSNEWLQNPYSLPWHGQPATSRLRAVDFQWSAATTVYRFFPEGIPYRSSIRVSTEHGTENGAIAMYTSAVFYYERPSAFTRIARVELEEHSSVDETEGGYSAPGAASTVLESDFVADGSGRATRTGRLVAERSELEFRLARRYRRLFLRRLFDQAEIQKAELTVNGRRLGVWAHNDPNETHRFAESDVWIPASLVGVDGRLHIELRVLSGNWVTFGYELYGEEGSP